MDGHRYVSGRKLSGRVPLPISIFFSSPLCGQYVKKGMRGMKETRDMDTFIPLFGMKGNRIQSRHRQSNWLI
jgi:hypothetical protein